MTDAGKKKHVFSGIQPSGRFTLGNYIGAIASWRTMQDEFRCLYSVVDLHALTVRADPEKLRTATLEAVAMLLANGIEPKKSIVFVQSHVPAHSELSWILGCYTMFGEMSRMTQFKDKSLKNSDNINIGLFTYPVLMAADILLYDTDLVPVGKDQKQHVEIARDIAARVNGVYRDLLVLPEPYIPHVGANIMSLADPTRKMSKSDSNPNATILLADPRDVILKKFKRAVTDSEACVRHGEGKHGINNLMTIYSIASGRSFEEIEREFDGRGYGEFKTAVGEAVDAMLAPRRSLYAELLRNKDHLESVYKDGAERAAALAAQTLVRVRDAVGLVRG